MNSPPHETVVTSDTIQRTGEDSTSEMEKAAVRREVAQIHMHKRSNIKLLDPDSKIFPCKVSGAISKDNTLAMKKKMHNNLYSHITGKETSAKVQVKNSNAYRPTFSKSNVKFTER